jgi:RND superfamily putative drug exporter
VPLQAFRQLAFAVSVGLILDAFIVRSQLAPALITLVGPRSGWPGRNLGVEDSERQIETGAR